MPIFEYTCQDCGTQFEEIILSEDETVVCKQCGSTNTAKLMSRCRVKAGSAGIATEQGETASAPQFRGRGAGCAGCSGGDCSSCS